jgi:hypothetical protein
MGGAKKPGLFAALREVALKLTAKLHDKMDAANLRDAAVALGIVIDKMLALREQNSLAKELAELRELIGGGDGGDGNSVHAPRGGATEATGAGAPADLPGPAGEAAAAAPAPGPVG